MYALKNKKKKNIIENNWSDARRDQGFASENWLGRSSSVSVRTNDRNN
jgi:hypothetical protein